MTYQAWIMGLRLALQVTVASMSCLAHAALAETTCKAPDRRIVVYTADRMLLLCDRSEEVARYKVHLGRGGVGKDRHGDEKVPLGVYSLGTPRKSKKFKTFIPIGYPTPEQRAKGCTGSAVGVHGPHQSWKWLGPLTNVLSSTAGCIGLGSNKDIGDVAAWVTRSGAKVIEIRER